MVIDLPKRTQSTLGQATTEYILLMAVIVGFFWIIVRALGGRFHLQDRLMSPVTQRFASVYKYGKAGRPANPNDDTLRPLNDGSFRVFFNIR